MPRLKQKRSRRFSGSRWALGRIGRPAFLGRWLLLGASTFSLWGADPDPNRQAILEELDFLKSRIAALEARLEANAPPATPPTAPTAAHPAPPISGRANPPLPAPESDVSDVSISPPTSPLPLDASGNVRGDRVEELEQRLTLDEARLDQLAEAMESHEQRLSRQDERLIEMRERTDGSSPDVFRDVLKDKWYERLSIRGYTQFRYAHILNSDGADLHVINDRAVSRDETFTIRRGRVILSGEPTNRLFFYGQIDFSATPGEGDWALQMRDLYADVSLDANKEYRIRVGQSKVPFGWVNLQSSQNRIPFERPDALNTAAEGERDLGVYFFWASQEARMRFRDLIRLGLKGSGDYGVLGIGAYSGQGLNRSDRNGEPHVLAHLSYPFKFSNGQYFEAGIHAYHGRYVVNTGEIPVFNPLDGILRRPPGNREQGTIDQRVGWSTILYPQPFGLEMEYNVGRGPQFHPGTHQIESDFLHGGYIQAMYRIQDQRGDWIPFARWHYYDGGRKFGRNAPRLRVNELDIGVEWQPWPEVEITVAYTRTFHRTNTRAHPYADTLSADRIGIQAQWNY